VAAGVCSLTSSHEDGARAQGVNQLGCAVILQETENAITAFAIVQPNQTTDVEYRFRTTRIGGAGTSSTESSGAQYVEGGETVSLASVTIGTAGGGVVDFDLEVSERLSSATCSAEETFDGL
jgi:hypothetical protein